jgi:quinol monooxygenase YgiN
MYGLIGKMIAVPGERETLIGLMLNSSGEMPGCLGYIVAKDAKDENAIWVTEVWDSEQSHKASLAIPEVKEAIAKAMPLIAAFEPVAATTPVGGVGLV